MPIRVKLTEEAVILTGATSSGAARMRLRSFMSLNINAYRSKTRVWYGCCCILLMAPVGSMQTPAAQDMQTFLWR
jgi:hypothetical protein